MKELSKIIEELTEALELLDVYGVGWRRIATVREIIDGCICKLQEVNKC